MMNPETVLQKQGSILEKVIDAFSRIEVQDLRVGRVTMPQRALDLIQYEGVQKYGTHGCLDHVCHDPVLGDGFTLWGADVIIGDRFEVAANGEWVAHTCNPETNERGPRIPLFEDTVRAEAVDYLVPFGYHFDIVIRKRGDALHLGKLPPEERVAIETLREMISEREFRRYMRDKFLLVQGASGRVYQIFRNAQHTKVWERGKLVQEVCVRIDNYEGVPPTDNVIAFLQIILTDESEFLRLGNVYNMLRRAA